MKAWFEISDLQKKVGIITDYFIDHVELKEVQRGNYFIVHEDKVKIIIEYQKVRQNRYY